MRTTDLKVLDLKVLTRRDWLTVIVGSVTIAFLIAALDWIGRHAWAIYKLNRGVGDTVFYDASESAVVPARRAAPRCSAGADVPYARDAVVAVEDHRFFAHLGIDPIGTARAVVHNASSGCGPAGWKHDYPAAGAHTLPVQRANRCQKAEGGYAGRAAGRSAEQARDSRAVFEPRLHHRWDLRRSSRCRKRCSVSRHRG